MLSTKGFLSFKRQGLSKVSNNSSKFKSINRDKSFSRHSKRVQKRSSSYYARRRRRKRLLKRLGMDNIEPLFPEKLTAMERLYCLRSYRPWLDHRNIVNNVVPPSVVKFRPDKVGIFNTRRLESYFSNRSKKFGISFLRDFFFKWRLYLRRVSNYKYVITFSVTKSNFFASFFSRDSGRLLCSVSSGKVGYKGRKRKSREAIEAVVQEVMERMIKKKILDHDSPFRLVLFLEGIPRYDKFYRLAVRFLRKTKKYREFIKLVVLTYPKSHNGMRPKKARRS